ncbi:MAG TPA: hypothetical protein VH834_19065 [Solirubrobacteraceae bacterium]
MTKAIHERVARRPGVLVAAAAALAAVVVGAGVAEAAAPVPCSPRGGGKYNCSFYVPGNGKSGGSPVQAGPRTVGYLHKGTNWVTCQQVGGRVTRGEFFNNNWAWTLADNNKAGWVNAVYASGGDNDGPFRGVPNCNGSHGAPPGAAGAPAPKPPPKRPSSGKKFPGDMTSARDRARYDDAGPWNGGANCSGGFTVGAKRLQDWIRYQFGAQDIGGYNCRPNTADTSKTSIHGVGRANDWFRNAGNPAQAAQVRRFMRRMSARGAAMARAMGIQYWIWNHQQYQVRNTGVARSSYGGPNPHTDHIHIEMNLPGSRLRTSYWRLAGR